MKPSPSHNSLQKRNHSAILMHWLGVVLWVWVAHPLLAGPIVYQGSYDPAGNPNDRYAPDNTQGGNTNADPVWQWNKGNTSPTAPTIVQINGVYALQGNSTDAEISNWGIGKDQYNTTAWVGSNSTGSTVDITIRLDSGSFYLRLGNESGYNYFYMQASRVWLGGSGGASAYYYMDTTDDFHVFRIAQKNGEATLYVDDNTTPLVANWDSSSSANFNNLVFGDFSTSNNSGGVWNLRNLSWTNAGAEFSAPVIPEPTIPLLLGLSSILVCLSRNRRRQI